MYFKNLVSLHTYICLSVCLSHVTRCRSAPSSTHLSLNEICVTPFLQVAEAYAFYCTLNLLSEVCMPLFMMCCSLESNSDNEESNVRFRGLEITIRTERNVLYKTQTSFGRVQESLDRFQLSSFTLSSSFPFVVSAVCHLFPSYVKLRWQKVKG